jgi:uncharacterized protein YlxP (DUF503 family)
MIVGSGIIELLIPESRSLKEKRSILLRLLKRTQNKFNVSIAEIGDNDYWRRAKIGFSIVGNDKRYIQEKIAKLMKFIEGLNLVEIITTKIEVNNISDEMTGNWEYLERKYDDF